MISDRVRVYLLGWLADLVWGMADGQARQDALKSYLQRQIDLLGDDIADALASEESRYVPVTLYIGDAKYTRDDLEADGGELEALLQGNMLQVWLKASSNVFEGASGDVLFVPGDAFQLALSFPGLDYRSVGAGVVSSPGRWGLAVVPRLTDDASAGRYGFYVDVLDPDGGEARRLRVGGSTDDSHPWNLNSYSTSLELIAAVP